MGSSIAWVGLFGLLMMYNQQVHLSVTDRGMCNSRSHMLPRRQGGIQVNCLREIIGTQKQMFTRRLAIVFTNQLTRKSPPIRFCFTVWSQELGTSLVASLVAGRGRQH